MNDFEPIGHCTGCKKPCFLKDNGIYWEIGTVCSCTGKLVRGHPLTQLNRMVGTILLLLIYLGTWHGMVKLALMASTMIGLLMLYEYAQGLNTKNIKNIYHLDKSEVSGDRLRLEGLD